MVLLVPVWLHAAANTDSTINIADLEKRTIVQRIAFEKSRIAVDYKSADERFFNLIDSIVAFVQAQDVPHEKQVTYLKRLQSYLQNINQYYTDSYLKNGTYLAVLSYYPVLIEWEQKDELLRNIKRYANFSVKATRLIPSDTVAEDFLSDYMKDHPDEIFRYAEEFADRAFAQRLLEKAVRLAPESVKRYYTSDNVVNGLLSRSRDLYIRKSYEIYSRFGVRSRAYLLLDDIVQKNMPIETADSLGARPDELFRRLVKISMQYDANVTYSIYRYMDIYCIDAMRKLNTEVVNGNTQLEGYKKLTPEEMFVLLGYGFKETTAKTIQQLMAIMRAKSTGIPISSPMITSMDKNKLKELVIFADKNELLDDLLALVDDEKKDYLLALTTLEEREDLFPPFKTFAKINPGVQAEPEDKAIIEISRVKPPRPVAADVAEEEPMPVIPEKPVTTAVKKETAAVTEEKKDIVPLPLPEPEVVTPVTIQIDERTRTVLSLKKNILQTIQNISSFIEKDYALEVLLYAAQKEPDELFKKIDAFKGKRFCLEVLEQCAINAPTSVKRYLYNANHPVYYILGYSKNPVVLRIFEMNDKMGYHSKPMLLLDDIIKGKRSVENAVETSKDPVKLFRALALIVSQPGYIGSYSIQHELRDYSLRFIREINDKIATGSSQPFYSVDGYTSQELYFLMLYGRDEVFTSTFNGLFARFLQKLPGGDGQVFLKLVNYQQFRDFVSLCANFGMLEDLLARFKAPDKSALLQAYCTKLEDERDNLPSVVLVAEALTNLTDDTLLTTLQQVLKKEYERVKTANDQIGISIYGVLTSIISGTAVTESGWYRKISQQFRVTSASSLSSGYLFGNNKVCVEQMFFYNDDDGRSSFINFMNTYRSQPAWAVEDRSSYVRIYSTQGQAVEILANKPENEENGISAIQSYLLEKNLSPNVIVHRGHSFHTESTLEKVPASARLVFVGSCGGFYKISVALSNAPEAHVISTKQVGTKSINDAMLFALNENIRTGKDIVWNEFWEKMREKLGGNPYFSDYIPPNKNLESIFIKAYYKILGV